LRFVALVALFLATVAVTASAAAALDWWIDPFQDRFHPGIVDDAYAQPKPCFMAWEVVGERAWPALKLDLFRRRHARTIVVGTSRVAKVGARPNEQGFVNMGVPGTGTESLGGLFSRLHAEHPGRLTVYLGADAFWFGRRWQTKAWFDVSYLRDLKYLLSGQTFRGTLTLLQRAPGSLVHPQRNWAWEIEHGRNGCIVDRGNAVLNGGSHAWAPDGSLWFNYEVSGARPIKQESLIDLYHPFYLGKSLDRRHLGLFRDALAQARSYGWRVIVFEAPISTRGVDRLERDPSTRGLFREFRQRMPAIVSRYGFKWLDLTDVKSVPCGENDFSFDDDGHPDLKCGMRVRAILDRAAAQSG
jgi:hypothetical protein